MNRNLTRGIGAVAAVALLGLGTAACSNDDSDSSSPNASAPASVKIGFMGDLTGANKALGINIRNGAKLAIDQYNETNPSTEITLVDYDSQGDPKQAAALAPKAIDDGIVGLVGPAFSGETADTGDAWQEAGIPFVSASATRVDLADNGWTTFHRVLADDSLQGPGMGTFAANGLDGSNIAVIDDGSDYGEGLATAAADGIKKDGGTIAVQDTVQAEGQTVPNYSSVISTMKAKNVDVVLYAGYYAQAGPFAKQIKDGGLDATFLSGDGSFDPAFIKGAGAAAEGAYLTCTCGLITADATGAQQTFFNDYQTAYKTAPGTYSGEGYDAATIFINGIKDGKVTAADLATYASGVNFAGVSGQIQFQENGNIDGGQVNVYKVVKGAFSNIGTTSEATG